MFFHSKIMCRCVTNRSSSTKVPGSRNHGVFRSLMLFFNTGNSAAQFCFLIFFSSSLIFSCFQWTVATSHDWIINIVCFLINIQSCYVSSVHLHIYSKTIRAWFAFTEFLNNFISFGFVFTLHFHGLDYNQGSTFFHFLTNFNRDHHFSGHGQLFSSAAAPFLFPNIWSRHQ